MSIFKKTEEVGRLEPSSPPHIGETKPTRSKNVSVIGPTLVFRGELSAGEDLLIEGQIEGTIAHHEKHLTVGKQGRVKADIHASSVIVMGQLIGDIHSENTVLLSKDANVIGDIHCGRIVMEDGARFHGKIDMVAAPKVTVAHRESAKGDTVPTKKQLAG